MKELSVEEKAKRYDEAIEKAKPLYKASEPMSGCNVLLETLFPELKKSEEERIKNELVDFIYDKTDTYELREKSNAWLAWLEKQGKPIDKIVERTMNEKQRVLLTETNGDANIDWDTRSLQDVKLLLEYGLDYIKKLEKQGEQKPTIIIPKFRVGDTIRIKNSNAEYTITEISDGYYRGKGWCLDIAAGDECGDYELVEQKPNG